MFANKYENWPLEYVQKSSRQFEHGVITIDEYIDKLFGGHFCDANLRTADAYRVFQSIPIIALPMIRERVGAVLQPSYRQDPRGHLLRPFTDAERDAKSAELTVRVQQWATALQRYLSDTQ